jgi:hypothetical protein
MHCTEHGKFQGAYCQQCADKRFEDALLAKDHVALAAECTNRMRYLIPGGSLCFRLGPDKPVVWRMPAPENEETKWENFPFERWGREAATALLQAAE